MAKLTLKQFTQKTLDKLDDTKREAATELFHEVIKDSPVGDPSLWQTPYAPANYIGGQFRSNWNASINRPDSSTAPTLNIPISEVTQTMQRSNRHTIDYLTNALPYADRLENEGWSSQAPDGIVKINAIRFPSILRRTAQ